MLALARTFNPSAQFIAAVNTLDGCWSAIGVIRGVLE
jgi:hypothetical protein